MTQNQIKVSVDIVAFGLIQEELCLLVGKRDDATEHGKWALPGGLFEDEDEGLEQAAQRVMEQKTHWRPSYMEQLQTFGGRDRDPRDQMSKFRTISIAYLTVCSDLGEKLVAGKNLSKLRWVPVQKWESLSYAFDHHSILENAIKRLRDKVEYSSLAAHFLPKEFTLSELQKIYEVILGHPLDKSMFRQNVKNANMVEPIEGKTRGGRNRPAQVYQVKTGLVIYPKSFVSRKI